jgi:hypothetical protein
VKLNELSDLPLSEAGSNYQDSRTAQLEALGLGIQVNLVALHSLSQFFSLGCNIKVSALLLL